MTETERNEEIARCRREQEEMRVRKNQPAWLVTLGVEDWEMEIRLIESEYRTQRSSATAGGR